MCSARDGTEVEQENEGHDSVPMICWGNLFLAVTESTFSRILLFHRNQLISKLFSKLGHIHVKSSSQCNEFIAAPRPATLIISTCIYNEPNRYLLTQFYNWIFHCFQQPRRHQEILADRFFALSMRR